MQLKKQPPDRRVVGVAERTSRRDAVGTTALIALRSREPERADGLANPRDEIGEIEDNSLLRVLDVALWMYAERRIDS